MEKKIEIVLTEEETSCLIDELDIMLQRFSKYRVEGTNFINPAKADALNKVYKALTGDDHYKCLPEHYNAMVEWNIEVMKMTMNPNCEEISKMKRYFK